MGTILLTEAYLRETGLITLEPGEEIKEITPMGEYYNRAAKAAKKCNLVFTNKRFLIVIDAPAKGGLFKKKTPPYQVLAGFHYDQFETLNQFRVGGDDTFCKIILKNGDDVAINIFGEFFGPLALKINTYAGLNLPKKRL